MSNVPPVFRINREDIPNAPAWVDNLLSPLNLFMQSVWTSISGNLTMVQNVTSVVKTLQFTTTAGYVDGTVSTWTPITFTSPLSTQLKSLVISQIAISATQPAVIAKTVTMQWHDTNGIVTIDYLTGLAPNTNYNLTVFGF